MKNRVLVAATMLAALTGCGKSAAEKEANEVQTTKERGMRKIIWPAAACVALLGCSDQPSSKPYTGRFKVDAGTEYVALDTPSIIGGACTGWNTVEIRQPGNSAGAMRNIICWKRESDNITITSRDGKRHTSGPSALWTD